MKSDHSEKYFLEMARIVLAEERKILKTRQLSVKSIEKLQAFNGRGELYGEGWALAYIALPEKYGDMWLIDCEQVFMGWDTDILQNSAEVVAVTLAYLSSWHGARHRENQPPGPAIFSGKSKQMLDRVTDLGLGEEHLLAAKEGPYMWGYVHDRISEIHDPEIIERLRPYGVIPHDFISPPPLET